MGRMIWKLLDRSPRRIASVGRALISELERCIDILRQ